jgi:hypothetical protein
MGYETIIDHFGNGNPYKKDNAQEEKFMEDLLLFVAKTYTHISIERSQGLKHSVMH